MGKKTNTTSKKTGAAQKAQLVADSAKRPENNTTARKKSSLTEKAVKVVAAVAAGVGGAIAAKRNTGVRQKTPPQGATVPAASELRPGSHAYTHEDIAMRAYFISENRRLSGQPADPRQDWLEAERELGVDNGAANG